MKKYSVFLLLFILNTTYLYSQSQNDFSYSAGIRLFSYGEYPTLLNEVRESDTYRTAFFNSLIFKFNDNQMSYRVIGTIYSNNNYSFNNICLDCEQINGELNEFSAKIGFERNVIYGPVQPFYGMDLGFKKIGFTGSAKDVYTNLPLYDVSVKKNGGLLYPFIGVKVNLLKARLTFSAEAGIDILYSHDKETKTYADGSFTIDNYKRWGIYNKPLGMLGLQFNFGDQ